MKRRDFLTFTAAALVAPAALQAATEYSPGLVQKALAEGKTVFLDFKASWCSTCARQERVINVLKSENPAYAANITFVNVDWDKYGRSDLAKSLNIPRRSTLVVLKGDKELGRIVAGTGKDQIKALMDTALAAAMA
ncbi:thioredoxin family protein [Aliiroseovarius sp. KMU-50]|uniref:Thioredoxin family protein n=1 Tax=Aliiroseovarius salicola TaxID=3009082 RepID=A0ABT4W5F4_9RHOB|nr:thioredoxin family protein [Aliiroseovarius sp. KMU-50]MDA5095042.1 thioredoxin family protein [Aliiroseovarius sp. KMU-50]